MRKRNSLIPAVLDFVRQYRPLLLASRVQKQAAKTG